MELQTDFGRAILERIEIQHRLADALTASDDAAYLDAEAALDRNFIRAEAAASRAGFQPQSLHSAAERARRIIAARREEP